MSIQPLKETNIHANCCVNEFAEKHLPSYLYRRRSQFMNDFLGFDFPSCRKHACAVLDNQVHMEYYKLIYWNQFSILFYLLTDLYTCLLWVQPFCYVVCGHTYVANIFSDIFYASIIIFLWCHLLFAPFKRERIYSTTLSRDWTHNLKTTAILY